MLDAAVAPDVLGYGQPVVGEQGEATLVLVGMALVVGAGAEGHPHGGPGPVGACKQVAGALGVVQQFGGRSAAVAGRQQVIASDRKSVVSGKRVSGRVDPGGGRLFKKKKKK